MGVKECSRKGCTHVMCDNYSAVTGYICYSCKAELEELEPSSVKEVELFMQTEKSQYDDEDGFNLAKMFGEDNE